MDRYFFKNPFCSTVKKNWIKGEKKKKTKILFLFTIYLSRVQGLYSISYFVSGGKPFFLWKTWIGKDDNEWKYLHVTWFLVPSKHSPKWQAKKMFSPKFWLEKRKKMRLRTEKNYFVEAAPYHPSASLQIINVELKISIKNSSLKKIRVSLGGILNLPQVMKNITLPENLHAGKYIIILCSVCVFNHRKTFPAHLFAEMNWSN